MLWIHYLIGVSHFAEHRENWLVTLSSSSRMRVVYHNWSATKQRPHLQSVAEISRHSVLSGDRIRQFDSDSMRNANKSPKVLSSATVREVEK